MVGAEPWGDRGASEAIELRARRRPAGRAVDPRKLRVRTARGRSMLELEGGCAITTTKARPDQRGLWARARARPWRLAAVAAVALAALAVVLVWFQPQRLLYDVSVDEGFPPAEADGAGDDVSDDAVVLARGDFASRSRYDVTGTAVVYELADGSRTLRLEDFESTNGPRLHVYLSAADQAEGDAALAEDYVDLGRLRGNVGNQNYDVGPDVDLATYDTVVIWCKPFSVGFGAADLASEG